MAKVTTDHLAIIIKKEFGKTNKKIDSNTNETKKVKASMVTKTYLDEKLADLRGDLVVLMRKEDNKVRKLIDILKKRNVISKSDEKEILAMEPFPELGLHLRENS